MMFGDSTVITNVLREDGYAVYRKTLQKYAGIPETFDDQQMLLLIGAGLPFSALTELETDGLVSSAQLSWILGTSLDGQQSFSGMTLSGEQSHRLYITCHLLAMAFAVMKEMSKTVRWLTKPKQQFQGQSIFEVAQTDAGAVQAENLIIRMADGLVL